MLPHKTTARMSTVSSFAPQETGRIICPSIGSPSSGETASALELPFPLVPGPASDDGRPPSITSEDDQADSNSSDDDSDSFAESLNVETRAREDGQDHAMSPPGGHHSPNRWYDDPKGDFPIRSKDGTRARVNLARLRAASDRFRSKIPLSANRRVGALIPKDEATVGRLLEYILKPPLSREPPSLEVLRGLIPMAHRYGAAQATDAAISQLAVYCADQPALVFALAVGHGSGNLLIARQALAYLGPVVATEGGRAVELGVPKDIFGRIPASVLQRYHNLRDQVVAQANKRHPFDGIISGSESGTSRTPWSPVPVEERSQGPFTDVPSGFFQTITSMTEYSGSSLEELRLEDYARQRRVGQTDKFQELWAAAVKTWTLG